MLIGTTADILVVSFLATQGILMAAIPFSMVLIALLAVLAYLPLVDTLKILIFKSAKMN
jgi:hypothetical protein